MKIDFERVYYDEVSNYLLFRSNPEKFYLLRVMDFNGGVRFAGTIENPEKIEQGSGVIGEYLLTKDEFDLWDTDEQAFHTIVDTLCKTAPSDRFLKMYYQRTPQSPQVPLKPVVGESMGTTPNPVEEMKNLFKFERNSDIARFKDFLHGKGEEDIYFIHSDRVRNIFPAIDFGGKMFFTEGEVQAKALTEATKSFGNQYYKVTSEQAKTIVENCKRYGVFKILFVKTDGEAFIMDRDELLDSPTDTKWDTYNSDIYNLLIRCIECAGIPNPQVRANQMTLTSQLSHRIFKSTFIVAVAKASESPENTVWLSSGAEKLRNEKEFVFSGAENFAYKNAPEEKFIIRTLINTKDKSFALPVFTDMQEFNAVLSEGNDIPLAVTLEELYSMKNEECNTILLNPATLGFIFTDEAMQQLTDLSKQPLMVFEPQKLEKQEVTIGDSDEKSATISIPEIPHQVSTESILNMVANQITLEDAVKKENIVKSDEEQPVILKEVTDIVNSEDTEIVSDTKNQQEKDETENKTEKKSGFFNFFKKKK